MKHKDDGKGTDFGVFMDAYDWQEAMKYAKFTFQDIKKVIFTKEGENDGANWELIVFLNSGQYGWLSAGCDYSGWYCRAGGESDIVNTLEEAINALGNKPEIQREIFIKLVEQVKAENSTDYMWRKACDEILKRIKGDLDGND